MNKVLKHWWLQAIFSICISSVLAQNKVSPGSIQAVSALVQQLQVARHDTTRIQLLIQLSTVYLEIDNYDGAFTSLQHGLQLAEKEKRPLYLGRVSRALAYYYDYRRITPQNIDTATKAVRFFQQAGQVNEAADALYFLSKICVGQGFLDKGIEQINKSLAYARQTGYYKRVCSAYCLLYELHKSLGQKKRVLEDLQAMKKAARDYKYPIDAYLANTSFAEWYADQKNYTKAVAYLQATLPIMPQVQKSNLLAMLYYDIATNLIHLKRFQEAEAYIDKSFEEAKKDKLMSQDGIQITLAHLREAQNRLSEAYQAALLAANHAREKHPYLALEYLKTLLRIEEKQGHDKQSLAILHELYTLNDSLKDAKNTRAIELAESRFALDKKEQDIILLKKNVAIKNLQLEQTYQQQIIYGLTTAGLIIILLLLGWFGWHTRKNLDKLEGQQAEIKRQSKRLQELNAFKDKLFLLIGHDFRSPLMHLKSSLAQLDMNQRTTEQLTRQIDQLKRTADSLYSNMDNLLHWAALQRTGMFTRPEQVELHTLVAETVDLLEPAIVQKNLLVAVAVGGATAWVDEDQVQIVLRNILHNAIKFTPSGGQIRVHFAQSATASELFISDTGVGMPTTDPQQAASLADRVGTLGETGTGLGLQVCDEFMKRNGGRLEIESEVGRGTTVRLIFLVADKALAAVG